LWYNKKMDKNVFVKIADEINFQRRQEIASIYTSPEIVGWVNEMKKNNWDSKRHGKAGWRRIASIPVVVDNFLTKVYGENYYKNKNFLKKMCKEWLIINPDNLK